MTRINTINPSLLTDSHLVAELREAPRIPNMIASGKAKVDLKKIPAQYVLGAGHVTFFYNKLAYIKSRHEALREEYKERTGKDFSITIDWTWLEGNLLTPVLFHEWEPTKADHLLNISRIQERLELRKRDYHYKGNKISTNQDVKNYIEKVLKSV